MINSINGEEKRLNGILPIVGQHNCKVIALAMDKAGMPKSVEDRMRVVRNIFVETRNAGVPDENVYIDPLIMTVATDTQSGTIALKSMKTIKSEFPEAHITGGLSNISYGLPGRSLINRHFLTLAIYAGMDSAIADPTDSSLRETLIVMDLLLGNDRFCRNYTQAHRSGTIGK